MSSDVFFMDMRSKGGSGLLTKLDRLIERAGFAELIDKNDLTAVKVHFGERGNLAYIRPQYIRRIVSKLKG
ncbi:MAG TPA: 4Fe-4S ferredoxin, partial [Desulfobacteria bacterium]|nr:4Fe-4S ferredoxin [Desulfobacteria bacterium]